MSQRLRDLAEFNKAAALELDVRLLQIFINGSAKVVRSWRENEFEAARHIRKLSPESKILFVSQASSVDVVQEAPGTGAYGYIVKTDAGSELLQAVNAVLRAVCR